MKEEKRRAQVFDAVKKDIYGDIYRSEGCMVCCEMTILPSPYLLNFYGTNQTDLSFRKMLIKFKS